MARPATRPLLSPAVLAALLAAASVTLAGCSSDAAPAAPRTAGMSQTSPGPTPAAAPAVLDGAVSAGTVGRAPGPFDDRFGLVGTRLAPDGVQTQLTVTSDVSDLLALEVTAAYYDAAGRLLGTGRVVRGEQHDASGAHVPDESLDLVVPVQAAWAPRVASAVLAVPVLVNE